MNEIKEEEEVCLFTKRDQIEICWRFEINWLCSDNRQADAHFNNLSAILNVKPFSNNSSCLLLLILLFKSQYQKKAAGPLFSFLACFLIQSFSSCLPSTVPSSSSSSPAYLLLCHALMFDAEQLRKEERKEERKKERKKVTVYSSFGRVKQERRNAEWRKADHFSLITVWF